ncbi:MAG TPA: glycosyltransferase [Opitutaceae bacterium]|nr:glycosyltransferase [Opitutaceae bacterium]
MNPPYSVVIATLHRAGPLQRVLASLAAQTQLPAATIVVDASNDTDTQRLCAQWPGPLSVRWVPAAARSAARQRNQGAELVATPLVCFMDDDIEFPPDTIEKLLAPFADPAVGGVAGRISDLSHPVPRGLLWLYYRSQAGYAHPHYGGRVIGAGINLLPAFAAETDGLIAAEWLNSGLVVYRRELFDREKFPAFDGYSFLEDAHLSYRIGRTHRLYFRGDAPYLHHDQPSSSDRDRRALARKIVQHQRLFARELQGLRGWTLAWKLTLHRLFQSIAVLRSRDPQRWRMVRGFWEA